MAHTSAPRTLSDFRRVPRHLRGLLDRRISQLGLQINNQRLDPFIQQLYRELRRRGLRNFQPPCYLSDEWGCPERHPTIGIPFYLADRRLARIEKKLRGYLEDEQEIMMFLRHEAGHAFSYAYRLYATSEWRRLFGPFGRLYRDKFSFDPESRSYVRHMANYYAQKHPDEDFAETFAVWLTPGSRWRRCYADWPAFKKLEYVERQARKFGRRQPLVAKGNPDLTVDQMRLTIKQFYRREQRLNSPIIYGHWSWTIKT